MKTKEQSQIRRVTLDEPPDPPPYFNYVAMTSNADSLEQLVEKRLSDNRTLLRDAEERSRRRNREADRTSRAIQRALARLRRAGVTT
jgi:hypothetical protein